MQGEASVCDPFTIPDVADKQSAASEKIASRSSPSNQGLDVTGASISSAIGEDGKPKV